MTAGTEKNDVKYLPRQRRQAYQTPYYLSDYYQSAYGYFNHPSYSYQNFQPYGYQNLQTYSYQNPDLYGYRALQTLNYQNFQPFTYQGTQYGYGSFNPYFGTNTYNSFLPYNNPVYFASMPQTAVNPVKKTVQHKPKILRKSRDKYRPPPYQPCSRQLLLDAAKEKNKLSCKGFLCFPWSPVAIKNFTSRNGFRIMRIKPDRISEVKKTTTTTTAVPVEANYRVHHESTNSATTETLALKSLSATNDSQLSDDKIDSEETNVKFGELFF